MQAVGCELLSAYLATNSLFAAKIQGISLTFRLFTRIHGATKLLILRRFSEFFSSMRTGNSHTRNREKPVPYQGNQLDQSLQRGSFEKMQTAEGGLMLCKIDLN